jgi:hypothetical protein
MRTREHLKIVTNQAHPFICPCGAEVQTRAMNRKLCDGCRKLAHRLRVRESFRRVHAVRADRVRVAKKSAPLPKREQFARLDARLGNPWDEAGFGVRPGVDGVVEVL